mmetsp:Transcript_5848/g.16563  ORF Transcript_5848/g.16563 Transcript_5848/m.16563 type:complete len:92 (-) Transcript_5848:13-288(-)
MQGGPPVMIAKMNICSRLEQNSNHFCIRYYCSPVQGSSSILGLGVNIDVIRTNQPFHFLQFSELCKYAKMASLNLSDELFLTFGISEFHFH